MIPFESLSYDQAVRKHGFELRLAQDAVVRVVTEPIEIDGDLRLDSPEEGIIFDGGWLFLAGLRVSGSLESRDVDTGPSVCVRGDVYADRLWLTGACLRVSGDLVVQQLLVATYNHGLLRVDGLTRCPLILSIDHQTELVGPIVGELIESEGQARDRLVPELVSVELDLAHVWKMARTCDALLKPAAAPAERTTVANDSYALAEALVASWEANERVIVGPNTNKDAFLEGLARALDAARLTRNPASALVEWLMDHPDVEDVLASDEEVVQL